MGIEVRPFGVRCNIACQYCYQNPERDAGNVLASYDLERIFGTLDEMGQEFILFGGEPLIMPIEDLERVWEYGKRKFQKNGVQTNGSLITDAHLALFERYDVRVGISIDGPNELNDVRWAGSLEKTREATAQTLRAIDMLCAAGRTPSLIVTLHRGNAAADKLPRMFAWVKELEEKGVRSVRLHLLEVESPVIRDRYALSIEENIHALRSFKRLEEEELEHLSFDVFKDMRMMLMGTDAKTTCVWNACDPYTTSAVQGVEGHGQRSNCGRTNKDGIDFVKSDVKGYERYIALYHTPQEYEGCQGCRFFLMCKGQCPGTSLHGDWRNRTEHCDVLKALYRDLEEEALDRGELPISAHPRRKELEETFLKAWREGYNTGMSPILKSWRKKKQKELAAAANGATTGATS